jgi:hypothetical protein
VNEQDKRDIIRTLKSEIAELREEIVKMRGQRCGCFHYHCHGCCGHMHWSEPFWVNTTTMTSVAQPAGTTSYNVSGYDQQLPAGGSN